MKTCRRFIVPARCLTQDDDSISRGKCQNGLFACPWVGRKGVLEQSLALGGVDFVWKFVNYVGSLIPRWVMKYPTLHCAWLCFPLLFNVCNWSWSYAPDAKSARGVRSVKLIDHRYFLPCTSSSHQPYFDDETPFRRDAVVAVGSYSRTLRSFNSEHSKLPPIVAS